MQTAPQNDTLVINSLRPSDTILWHKSGSTLAQVITYCLLAPSCYHNIKFISGICDSPESNWTACDHATISYNGFENYTFETTDASPRGLWVNSLGPSDAIWRCKSWSTLVQVMACCLMAPSHYLNQCWLIISKVLWHSSGDIIIRTNQ